VIIKSGIECCREDRESGDIEELDGDEGREMEGSDSGRLQLVLLVYAHSALEA